MANIRISALPSDASPTQADVLPIDGSTTRKATIKQVAEIGRPAASQAEAETGTDPSKAMTPLTVKQSIAAEVGSTIASKAQGDKADSATQPGDLGNSAARDVGTTAGTVAAGDDGRITGAIQSAATDASTFGFVNSTGPLADSDTTLPAESVVNARINQKTPFALRSDANGATIDSGVTHASTVGFAAIDDGGDATYAFTATDPSMPGQWSPADGRFAEIIPAARYKPSPFGILPEDNGAAALINDAMEWMRRRRSGGRIEYLPEEYYINETIDHKYHNIFHQGAGNSWLIANSENPSELSNWNYLGGTRFTWVNATGDVMMKWHPDGSGPRVTGGGLDDIVFNCAGLATKGLQMLSSAGAKLGKVLVDNPASAGFEFGGAPTGDFASIGDLQHLEAEFLASFASGNATAIIFTGVDSQHTSLSKFGRLFYTHENGSGIRIDTCDTLGFGMIHGYRPDGKIGEGIRIVGGDNPLYPRSVHMGYVQTSRGGLHAVAFGDSNPVTIRIAQYSRGNASPLPVIDAGCDVTWVDEYTGPKESGLSAGDLSYERVEAAAGGVIASWAAKARSDAGTLRTFSSHLHYLVGLADGAENGRVYTQVKQDGSDVLEFRVDKGVSVGAGTGTEGAGTLNVQNGVYVNGVLSIDAARGVRLPVYTAAQIADATHAVNTANKVQGKLIYDSTNARIMIANGTTATSAWWIADGSNKVTPA